MYLWCFSGSNEVECETFTS